MFMRRTTIGFIASTGLVAAMALPAAGSSVDVQFTVSAGGGGLFVDTAQSTATLDGTTVSLLDAADVVDTLPSVTITDNRASTLGANWALGVSGTDWVNQTDNAITLGRADTRVYLDAVDLTTATVGGLLGGMTVSGGELVAGTNNLSSSYTLLSGATAPLLTGAVTVTPTMSVVVPAEAAVGTYQSTVTYSAS